MSESSGYLKVKIGSHFVTSPLPLPETHYHFVGQPLLSYLFHKDCVKDRPLPSRARRRSRHGSH